MPTPCLRSMVRAVRGSACIAALLATIGPLMLVAPACAPDPAKTMSNPTLAAQRDPTPLPLDPTSPVPVVGWWTNGHQLLHLGDDGAYRLWTSMNRFGAPMQTGRWSRQNYKTLWLEPYAVRTPERTRCELDRSGSEVRLLIDGLDSMVRFDEAPSSIEDRLVGSWSGAGGSLRITADGRYRADAPAGASSGAPIALAGHAGRWIVDGATLLLLPDSPSVPPVLLAIEPSGPHDLRLRAGDGAYRRTDAP